MGKRTDWENSYTVDKVEKECFVELEPLGILNEDLIYGFYRKELWR